MEENFGEGSCMWGTRMETLDLDSCRIAEEMVKETIMVKENHEREREG